MLYSGAKNIVSEAEKSVMLRGKKAGVIVRSLSGQAFFQRALGGVVLAAQSKHVGRATLLPWWQA